MKVHGNEKPYFFATNPPIGGHGYPHCPCRHRHRTLDVAMKCAIKDGKTQVYEMGKVGDELKAVAVHAVGTWSLP